MLQMQDHCCPSNDAFLLSLWQDMQANASGKSDHLAFVFCTRSDASENSGQNDMSTHLARMEDLQFSGRSVGRSPSVYNEEQRTRE